MNPYWNAVKNALPIILFVSLVSTLVAYGISSRATVFAQAHFSLMVSLSDRETSGQYQFDGYYALSATELFAETLSSLITSPEAIVEAHSIVGIPLVSNNPRKVVKIVKAAKTASQLVQVTVIQESPSDALRLAEGVMRVAVDHVARYNAEGIPAIRFRVVATKPWVGSSEIAVSLISVATLLFTFFISVNGVLLKESMMQSQKFA